MMNVIEEYLLCVLIQGMYKAIDVIPEKVLCDY